MSASAELRVADFAGLVGAANVRDAGDDDVVHGVRPRLVVAPGTEDEASVVLREASRAGLAVVIRGAGTKLTWGAPPRTCDMVLSTHRLDALVEHEPGDLVCVAQAGMRLEALQAVLVAAAGHRQRLMLDPFPAGTLGGIVATAASGPLRNRYGTPRAVLIGARFVLADGTIGHTGGKVVKNVAGYDLAKLLTGSLGTLALITQVAFRLHPDPPASRTVLLDSASPDHVVAYLNRLRRLPVVPSCVDVLWPDGVVRVRIDGSADSAERQAQGVAGGAGGRVLDDREAALLDARIAVRPWDLPGAIVGVALPRTHIGDLLELASGRVEEVVLRGTLGTGEARLAEDAAAVTGFRQAVATIGGHVVLQRSPAALGAVAWPPGDDVAVELMRSVKRALDLSGVLAPGRFLAAI
ncbi:MAG TPA: FAD-binding oxidoreductase [Candidatus Dormibacteraeota bacterium]